jgi:hypothetical protein
MYTPSFNGCWAKAERAKKHRDELDTYIAATFAVDGNRPRLGINLKAQGKVQAIYVREMPDLDPFLDTCGAIIGDIAHNLRSLLDHLCVQLALRNTDGQLSTELLRRVQFPIEDDPATFEWRCEAGYGRRDRSRGIGVLHQDDRTVLERFQPYHAGNEGLGLLRELSDSDKHRLAAPVLMSPTKIANFDPAFAWIVNEHVRHSWQRMGAIVSKPVKLGAELYWAPIPPGQLAISKMDMTSYVLPDVAFPEWGAVLPAIDGMAAKVLELLSEFDPRP